MFEQLTTALPGGKSYQIKILAGFGIIVFAMIAYAYVMYLTINNIQAEEDKHNLVSRVQVKSAHIIEQLANMENSQRGFLIVGREKFLEPYRIGKEAFQSDMALLKGLVREKPSQVSRLEIAEALAQEWHEKIALPEIETRRKVVRSEATINDVILMTDTESGKRLMEAIRGVMADFVAEEQRMSKESEAHSQEVTQQAFTASIVGVFLAIALGGVVIFAVVRGVTGSLNRELTEAVRARNSILDAAGEGIYGVDLDGLCTFINPAAEKLLGWKPSELVGKPQHDLLHHTKTDGSHYPRTECPIYHAFTSGVVQTISDEVFWREDGSNFPVEYTSTPIFEAGETVGAVVIFRDISERIITEQTLKDKEHQLLKAQTIAGLGNWSWRIADGVEVWSDQQFRIFGYEPDEVAPSYQLFIDAIHPDDRSEVLEAVDTTLKDGEPYSIDFRIIRPDGEERFIAAQGEVERDDEGAPKIMVGTVLDITERKSIELKLVQSTKMATLGEMATGVAHELNQPLNVIRMAVSNIQRKSSKDEASPEYLKDKLEKVENQVERASAIIDHMRIFGRRADINPAQLDPKAMVDGTLGLIGEQLRLSGVEVRVDAPETCPVFMGHQVQVEQVLLNLLGNARDQLSGRDGEKRIDVAVVEGDNTVQIIIEDTGGGIPDDVLPRIFEPFFTTKAVGSGTGLGLSISYGIIADMGGTIEAMNTTHGARFTITLPVYDSRAAVAAVV